MEPKDVPLRGCVSIPNPTAWTLLVSFAVAAAGCSIRDVEGSGSKNGETSVANSQRADQPNRDLFGRISIDGSSTVYPITQAAAEEFMKLHRRVAIPIGVAGTAGGFKRFVVDELDICNASRPIEPEEVELCHRSGVEYVDFPIGMDGVSVVVNAKNTWCDALTVGQLRKVWESHSRIKTWDDVDPSYPKQEIVLYGPDTDSGTFEYFTEVICGRRGNSRTDYTPSSNDNVLIQGVEGDIGALGYFGYAYYSMNRGALRALRIVPEGNPSTENKQTPTGVAPSEETIRNGQYKPLSRSLFLYVNRKALKRPEVAAFLTFYMEHAPSLVSEVHYIPLPPARGAECRARLKRALESN
jgi:phosphate transport system substrate-binding protein